MFGMNTKRRLDMLERQLDRQAEQYRELERDHRRLLSELGYTDHHVIEHKVLRKKGGPERGDPE